MSDAADVLPRPPTVDVGQRWMRWGTQYRVAKFSSYAGECWVHFDGLDRAVEHYEVLRSPDWRYLGDGSESGGEPCSASLVVAQDGAPPFCWKCRDGRTRAHHRRCPKRGDGQRGRGEELRCFKGMLAQLGMRVRVGRYVDGLSLPEARRHIQEDITSIHRSLTPEAVNSVVRRVTRCHTFDMRDAGTGFVVRVWPISYPAAEEAPCSLQLDIASGAQLDAMATLVGETR